MRSTAWQKCLVFACVAGCAAAPVSSTKTTRASTTSQPSASTSSEVAVVASVSATPQASGSTSAVDVASSRPSISMGQFSHDIEEPIHSIGVGDPRVAALGMEPWIFEKNKWKKIAFPSKFRPTNNEPHPARIFFGRDDRPRIMGAKDKDGKLAQLYLRYKDDEWMEERKEIAKLLDTPVKPLFGVLGHADPEVACKMDDECIIKRRTGWKRMPSGPLTPRVDLQHGFAWALYPDSIARLEDDKRWVTIGAPAPFKNAAGFCALGGQVWVSEAASNKLFHYADSKWQTSDSVLTKPSAMWCAALDDVYLTGAEGLAHYNGKTWSLVTGPKGPLTEIMLRGEEIWVAGPSGLWSRKNGK